MPESTPAALPDALMETPMIRFNLRDLGRRYTGKKRNFDIGRCVSYVNSPECQERVKTRGVIGYYGHFARQAFDRLFPHEGGVVNGKWCAPDPAVVTTYLQASPDGTIEHKAQFLNTDAGKLAAKLHESRVGGFSAIWKDRLGTALVGFDYVLDPNFNDNRGYVMDSASAEDAPYSLALGMESEAISGVLAVFDSLSDNLERAGETIRSQEEEINNLMSMLVAQGGTASTAGGLCCAPAVFDSAAADRMIRDAANFSTASLRLPHNPDETPNDGDPVIRQLIARVGR